jgi:hypothetical protein
LKTKRWQLVGLVLTLGSLLAFGIWSLDWSPQLSEKERFALDWKVPRLGRNVTNALLANPKIRPADLIRERLAAEPDLLPGLGGGVIAEMIIASDADRWLTLDEEIVLVVHVPHQRHIKAFVYHANCGGRMVLPNEDLPQIAAPTESIHFSD